MKLHRVVVDTSVALKWMLPEEDTDAAAGLLDAELWVPTLLFMECGNALWREVRRGHLTSAEAGAMMEALEGLPLITAKDLDLVKRAFELTAVFDHPIYDCIFLTLAERIQAPLVTADKKLHDKVRNAPGFAGTILLLGNTGTPASPAGQP